MKCKKHPTDFTSSVGVCASCLRERLFALIAAQVQAQAQAQVQAQEDRRKSDTNPPPPPAPPPLLFPRSVSPYISRRKSENATATWQHHILPDQKFFSTPQVGPTGAATAVAATTKKKNYNKFSLLLKLFRSKSLKPGTGTGGDSDPRVSDSLESGTASSSSPSSWFSTILPSRRKKQTRTFSLDESTIKGHRKSRRNRDRGMSPVMYSDGEDEHCHVGSSGYSSESSQGWKQTPRRTPASTSATRRSHNRNVSGIAFCLSPLVRASPNRFWNQKGGVPPEMVVAGEIRLPVKPHLSAATSFCKNRSRKLADFGRFNRNHG